MDDRVDVGGVGGVEMLGHAAEDFTEDLGPGLAGHPLGQLLVGDLGHHRCELLSADVLGLGIGYLCAHFLSSRRDCYCW